jgi:hypothetical protein
MENFNQNKENKQIELENRGKTKKKGWFEKFFAGEMSLKIIGKVDTVFIKLPHLPKKLSMIISKIFPWLVLFGGILGIIATILSSFLALLAVISLDLGLIFEMVGSLLIVILNMMFLVKAFGPLRKYNAIGWIYLFWASVLNLGNSIVNIIGGDGNILVIILSNLISFYLLFEIGPLYVYKRE